MIEYIRYLRDTNRVPYGVIVATDSVHVGWALCNPLDQFDKKLGKRIARSRMARKYKGVDEISSRHRVRCKLRDKLFSKKHMPTDRLYAMAIRVQQTAAYLKEGASNDR